MKPAAAVFWAPRPDEVDDAAAAAEELEDPDPDPDPEPVLEDAWEVTVLLP